MFGAGCGDDELSMQVFGRMLIWFSIILVAMAVLLIVAGRLGWLQGTPPADLGVRDGRLKPPSITPNSVSSQATLLSRTSAAQLRGHRALAGAG